MTNDVVEEVVESVEEAVEEAIEETVEEAVEDAVEETVEPPLNNLEELCRNMISELRAIRAHIERTDSPSNPEPTRELIVASSPESDAGDRPDAGC